MEVANQGNSHAAGGHAVEESGRTARNRGGGQENERLEVE